jgi:uncharacterized protein YbbK (DUF523 family)
MTHERIRLGISACLLGEPVRFDGGHKRDPFLVESLGQFVDWVPVCPEVESGLDAPRESMRLVETDDRIRLLTNKTAQDHTTRMRGYARRRVEELVDDALVGFVLKKDSPTCGLERVKVHGTAGMPMKSGRGLFAHALVTRFSLLPVEEEGRFNDPRLRENFVERIFAYLLDCNMSIAVRVGLIALLGVDAQTGVFMLLYPRVREGSRRRTPAHARRSPGDDRGRRREAVAPEVHDDGDDVPRAHPDHVGHRHGLRRVETNRRADGWRHSDFVRPRARRLSGDLRDLEVALRR